MGFAWCTPFSAEGHNHPKAEVLTSRPSDIHETGFTLPFWSHQPVPWVRFPPCLFQLHSLHTLSCLWEICRSSGSESYAVHPGDEHLNWPSLFLQKLMQFKKHNASRHCSTDLSPQSLQGRLPGRGRYQGPSAEPYSSARKQAPSAATRQT